MRNNKKKFNEIYQDLLRKVVMFGVLSMLLLASARVTGWIIMEYAGFVSAIYNLYNYFDWYDGLCPNY